MNDGSYVYLLRISSNALKHNPNYTLRRKYYKIRIRVCRIIYFVIRLIMVGDHTKCCRIIYFVIRLIMVGDHTKWKSQKKHFRHFSRNFRKPSPRIYFRYTSWADVSFGVTFVRFIGRWGIKVIISVARLQIMFSTHSLK